MLALPQKCGVLLEAAAMACACDAAAVRGGRALQQVCVWWSRWRGGWEAVPMSTEAPSFFFLGNDFFLGTE